MRLGTRASALALAQARLVIELLGEGEIIPIVTRGDRGSARGTEPVGEDKSRWVGELEGALARGEIDLAVHSAKDLPGELGEGLALVGAPARAGAEDVLCGARGLDELSAGARVGTSSIRRMAQLRAVRDDLHPIAIRGNVDTRLRKLHQGELDAIVIARAGLQRLGREAEAGALLDPERFVPAPGQGTLALQARTDDAAARAAIAAICEEDAFTCLLAERALAGALGASCHTPLGAHAELRSGQMRLRGWAGMPDGSVWVADELSGDPGDPQALGRAVAERLELAGAAEILRQAEELAARQARGRSSVSP